MKTTVDTDLLVSASEEAKICLNCEKPKCIPYHCKRFEQMKEEVKQEKLHRNKKNCDGRRKFQK